MSESPVMTTTSLLMVLSMLLKMYCPMSCLQFEDFRADPMLKPLLDKYRDQLCTFNDDIQGTAAVTLGALLAAVKVAGSSLDAQRIVVLGGGFGRNGYL